MRLAGLWVLIPLKDLVNAKQRLSGVLSSSERRALCQAMVEDMLQCLRGVSGIDGILLVSDDPAAELLAYRYGAQVLKEKGQSRGLNSAVQQAASYLEARGASHVLVLHGDMPGITVADVGQLIQDIPSQPFVRLVPDCLGQGSNGLLCSLPAPLPFSYGEGSFPRHLDAARRGKLECQTMPLSSLQLDIDTPADLQALLNLLESGAFVGAKTQQVLREVQLARRLPQLRLNEPVDPSRSTTTGDNTGAEHGN